MLQLSYEERELRVMQAYEAFQDDKYINIVLCVREFEYSWQNLRNRFNNIFSKSTRFSICRRHTNTQKQVIVNYIIRLNNINILLTINFVVDVANCLFLFDTNFVD